MARGNSARFHDHVARRADYRHRPPPSTPDHRTDAGRGRRSTVSPTPQRERDEQSLSKSGETWRSIAASAGYESVRGVADALADAFESMALDECRPTKSYMSGTSHLAHSRSLAHLAPLFDALEEQVVLMKLMSNLSEETNASGVGVAIGSEMHTPGLRHASVVSSGYGRSGGRANRGERFRR